jgi:hypothetical protein
MMLRISFGSVMSRELLWSAEVGGRLMFASTTEVGGLVLKDVTAFAEVLMRFAGATMTKCGIVRENVVKSNVLVCRYKMIACWK